MNDYFWFDTALLEELVDYLSGPLACDFQFDKGKIVWNCSDGKDRPFTRKWLESKGLPIDEWLDALSVHGGNCDCEVAFNCDPRKFCEAEC